ncbi:unnamed protein product [Symbiodinium pilosum]|uniref:Uncharacterized protein n=1 Tax=Symbiodinium pilosum TaxID=2952 RepID=A0A812TJ27_SYMPI|nr:unnamed protein product [Symbiodinium pilosum]
MYDKFVREPGHKPTECSPGSVTLRHDAAHMIRQVGDLMFQNARLLEDLVKTMGVAIARMAVAERYNPTFQQSAEYKNWVKAAAEDFDTCASVGPVSQVESEDEKQKMKEMLHEDLLGLCETYSTEFRVDLNCHAKNENRAGLQERLQNFEELRKGAFNVQEMEGLILDVKLSSPAGKALEKKVVACKSQRKSGADDCLSSLDVLRIMLAEVDLKPMKQLCTRKGLICKRKTTKKLCLMRCSTAYDKQALALKILVSAGGGSSDMASASDPFGTCDSDHDCWLENTECIGKDEERFCQCKEDHCYTLVQNPKNQADKADMIPFCKERSKEWRGIANQVKRNFLTYRYTLGQMIGQMKNLPA